MERSQRADDNHALEYAISCANRLDLPVVATLGLDGRDPGATERSCRFLLEGLVETRAALARRGVRLVVREGSPPDVALGLAARAALMVCDRGYLRHQRAWRRRVGREAPCAVTQVESDAVVPVDEVATEPLNAARTLRPRIHRQLERFMRPVPRVPLVVRADGLEPMPSMPLEDLPALARRLGSRAAAPVSHLHAGGARAARARLEAFVTDGLHGYAGRRRRIEVEHGSGLGPYLHLGQLSPLRVALRIHEAEAAREDREAFLEQVVVRRELAANFTEFRDDYDRFEAVPGWARTTLARHRRDPRPWIANETRVEACETPDPYFNAAMLEMRETGAMHNTMRMYWGKKLLEWSQDTVAGFELTLRLNNRYLLDGFDPNSYAGVSWCYGTHDRPWPERPVYGTVRSMTAGGLRRKHDPEAYVARVRRRVAESASR
jgi:deoxyribodipyrimidine photo-lyase